MMDAMKGDLLDTGWDVVKMGVDEGAPSVDGIHGRMSRQLKGLQLHCQGWRS